MGKRANELGKFIRGRRLDLNLFQRDIADALGSGPEFIGMIEKGTRQPNFERLPALARVLRVPTFILAKLAFTDVYPKLANSMFRNKHEFLKRASIHPEIRDAATKLQALPDNVRMSIVEMIDKLYEQAMEEPQQVRKRA
jgi:transcriptional regulator with XRE-family HTH domain